MTEGQSGGSGVGGDALKELAIGGRGALRRTFGSALTEFGEMLSDQVKLWRFKNLLKIREKVERIVGERNIPDEILKALSFGDAMRTLETASQEDEDDIQELWACLIVNASTSSTSVINKLHIEILRSLSPADRALLELLYPSLSHKEFTGVESIRIYNDEMNAKAEASWRKFSDVERDVSVQNLIRLRCITATPRVLDADRVLQQYSDRTRRVSGALVDPNRFRAMLTNLIQLIYQSAGAVPYDAQSPIPVHSKGAFGFGQVGEIRVPELNHMLTPLGEQFMSAITLTQNLEERARVPT